jgi:soluble lytic murein transglycosylase-like protein
MTTLENNTYYSYLDSPLSRPEDEFYWIEGAPVYAPDPVSQVHQRMIIVLLLAVTFVFGFGTWAIRSTGNQDERVLSSTAGNPVDTATEDTAAQAAVIAPQPATGGIAPLFTREVQHWAPQIVAWANEFGIDPNMAATVMQIESCGDPNAVSSAGAQGLFQVMPFHFEPGENMQDPDTNARRGMAYLALGMQQTSGDTSRTFAGYNGGHGTAARAWETWPNETQRYYVWSTGIYKDAVAGSDMSETLNNWLAAGGAGLCRQAAARIGLQ